MDSYCCRRIIITHSNIALAIFSPIWSWKRYVRTLHFTSWFMILPGVRPELSTTLHLLAAQRKNPPMNHSSRLPSFKQMFQRYVSSRGPSRPNQYSPLAPTIRYVPAVYTATPKPKAKGTCRAPKCSKRGRAGGFCVSHGGGKKCSTENCKRAVQTGGVRGKCFAHGGGKRCAEIQCNRAAIVKGYCKSHMKARLARMEEEKKLKDHYSQIEI